jgi:hypothetical protein
VGKWIFILGLLTACSQRSLPPTAGPGPAPEAPRFDGNSGGNGGDPLRPEDGAAWFLGEEKVIRACTVVGKFPVSEKEFQKTADAALAQWKDYIDAKKIAAASDLATTFEWVPGCKGTIDLTFYLGASTPRTDRAKRHFSDPMAFAERDSYDPARGWTQGGFVWLAAFTDWTYPNALHAMLLHELGHVLGCGHVAETIMSEKLALQVRYFQQYRPTEHTAFALTQIDQARELYVCDECAIAVEGPLRDRDSFNTLTGRDAKGLASLAFSVPALRGDSRGTLTLSDLGGSIPLKVSLVTLPRKEINGGLGIFRTFQRTPQGDQVRAARAGKGLIVPAWITAASGKPYTIELQVNAGNSGRLLELSQEDASTIFDTDGVRAFQIQGGLDLNGGATLFRTPLFPGDRSW